MGNQLKQGVSAHTLAKGLGITVFGKDVQIRKIASLSHVSPAALCYSKAAIDEGCFGAAYIAPTHGGDPRVCVLISETPRLTFAKAVAYLEKHHGFINETAEATIHPSAKISDCAEIGKGVTIGRDTVINSFAVLHDGVTLGERCYVKSGAVIGEEGFGFERDTDGTPIRLLHLGSVRIGNDVEIGSLTTVCRGTLDDTILEDHVKIDDHVHIAHNCIIHVGALITACAEISGGVEIGEYAWIGPNASVIQQKKLGARSLVGIAANVLKDVDADATVIGNPAKPLVKVPL